MSHDFSLVEHAAESRHILFHTFLLIDVEPEDATSGHSA